jgi:hemin uptake protein HemP
MSDRTEYSNGMPEVGRLREKAKTVVRTLTSRELFADASVVVIEHEGEQYRLRSTKKRKLILTK